jgi:hypothetical protein
LHRGLLAFLLLSATAHATLSQPDGEAKLQVRLLNHITSSSSPPGTPFRCAVIAPFGSQGAVLIPKGSLIYGTVRRTVSVKLGLLHERASIDLNFSAYERPDGRRLPMTAKLASIDNAREEVSRTGEIKGVLATADRPDGLVNGIWDRPTLSLLYRPLEGLTGLGREMLERFPMGPAAPAVVLGLRCLILRFPEPEIHLVPGTDFQLSVDQSRSEFIREAAPEPLRAQPEWNNWIAGRPLDTEKPNGHQAADLVNLAFIGSRQELIDAFSAAGWHTAESRSFRSFRHVYAAFDEKKGYDQAPVSRLLYQGHEPDLVFEKSFDTIAKRHHIRIWNAGVFENADVWVGAATHDVGIGFDAKLFPFRHAIDLNLDSERQKIVIDLVYSGCSSDPAYADSGETAHDQKPGAAVTDGRIAILTMQSCLSPREIPDDAPLPPGNKASRFARRVILEARDYVFRENAYFLGYELVRRTLHKPAKEW